MRILQHRTAGMLLVLAFAILPIAAGGDGWRYRDHDIHRFRHHDFDVWRHGHWHHGWHDGRFGWWWVAGGVWYLYPAPVYPYPDPYVPPPVVVLPPPPPPGFWYYCKNPPGYYPYVPVCYGPWHSIPATP
jgi:hypothetical protein